MFRRPANQQSAFGIACTLLLNIVISSLAVAQQQPAPKQAATPQKPSPELWELLTKWSEKSSSIKTMTGKHQRKSYDSNFGVEKISQGKFGYEAPDRGRIDITPIKVTAAMLKERKKPGAKVEIIKSGPNAGQPFKLEPDSRERWVCDGTKVFDIDDEQKIARIGVLPPQVRGQNIMNSPLPFLFGLPPEKAVRRFHIAIETDWRPKYTAVRLVARPRTKEDARNWSRAYIDLDTKSFLPMAIRLIDTAETSYTTYLFKDMKVNGIAGPLERLFKNPFEPNLDGYQVHVIQPTDQNVAQGQNAPRLQPNPNVKRGVMPNLLGHEHTRATQLLLQAGIVEANISRRRAGPAPQQNWTYRVAQQEPAAEVRIEPGTKVQLFIYDKPVAGANAARPQGSRVARGGN